MNLDSFFNKYNGQSLLYAPSPAREDLRGQCVQLVAQYVSECWAKPVIWDDAYGWYADGRLPEHYIRVANDRNDPNQLPPRGALVVFAPSLPGSGGLGHIDICWQATPGSPTWVGFDSNWGGKTAHLVTHNWQYVVGWLIPRGLPTQTPVPQQGADEVIATTEDSQLIYRILRPNGGASQGEIDATTGKRTFHNFLHDALPELQIRDQNLTNQQAEFAKMQTNINELNATIADLRSKDQASQEEQHAAQEKISYLTSQIETSHDKITDLQNANVPLQGQLQAAKPNWLTTVILAGIKLLPGKKK
jgi:hypothetical protein